MEPILTVGITSYKRIKELIRCITSIQTEYVDEIEILVSEDKSPLSKEIEKAVDEIAKESEYNIRFSTNDVNLGYDMNLGAIISKARGKYVFLMSDDDALTEGCLNEIIPVLRTNETAGVFYAPFVYEDSGKRDRNRGKKDFVIPPGEESAAKYIYDSILFSGLIFRKEYVSNIDSSRFKNYNYFQVYLFLQMLLKHGGYFFSNPSVLCIGDGENAYGLSESSKDALTQSEKERNEILSDRKSIKSDLEFNKTLIKTIKLFDSDEGTAVFESFEKQYSLHSISGLTIARRDGKVYFKEYWHILNSLDIHIYWISKIYYCMLLLLGADITTFLLSGFRRMMKKEN